MNIRIREYDETSFSVLYAEQNNESCGNKLALISVQLSSDIVPETAENYRSP